MNGATFPTFLFVFLSACRVAPPAIADGGGAEGIPPPDAALDSPVGQGYLAVEALRCGDCHQSPDPADGVLSGRTSPVATSDGGAAAYGSNLTPDPDTGMDAWDAGSIANAVRAGIDAQGRVLCGAMPKYADASDDVAFAIAAYLRSLVPVWHPIPASTCPPVGPAPAADGG